MKERLERFKKELKASKEEAEALQHRCAIEEEALKALDHESIEAERKEQEALLQQLSQSRAAYTATEAEYQRNSKQQQHTQTHLQEQLKATQEAVCKHQEEVTHLGRAQEVVEQKYEAATQALEEAGKAHEERRLKTHEMQLKHNSTQSQYERLRAEYDLHSDYLRIASDKRSRDQHTLKEVLEQQQKLEEEQQNLGASLREATTSQAEQIQRVNSLEQTYYKQRNTLSEQEQKIRALDKQHANAQLLQSELENRLAQLQEELKHLHEQFRVELGSSLEEIYPEAVKEAQQESWDLEDTEALEQSVQQLRAELKGIGAINPLAAESFKEMKERHAFMSQEQEDLLKAQSSIQTTLEEIEKTVHNRFTEAFKSINTHFQQTFRTLFSPEDICTLELSNEKSSEELEVEIIAQPKGKRPMRIEQLSSGEKALTAIALLVAIYLYKPSPFCILDEVDAPLDDTNSDKFNQLIRTLSDRAQFILITHNKRTMQNSDILYGFTMPEVGVTRILPVDLRTLGSSASAPT